MASRFTQFDLDNLTDYFGFERFCNDLMSREGYKDIQPLGGHKDKGRDAIHFDRSTGTDTIFAYTVREDWEDKLKSDLEKVEQHGHPCQRFVFVTTAQITSSEFDTYREVVRKNFSWELDLFYLERLCTLVENHYRDLIQLHPNIFHVSSKISDLRPQRNFDPHTYVGYLLGLYEQYVEQYTPLLAEHREMDTFVDLRSEEPAFRIPVAEILQQGQICILLGESGAGKTISLWKIVEQACRSVQTEATSNVPVLFNLRGWSRDNRCRELLQEEFELLDVSREIVEQKLRGGLLLILLDGMNEVPQANRSDCYYDVARLVAAYPGNSYVISCRSSDYHPTLLPTKDIKPPIADPHVYEICRLDRDQIIAYAETYFARHSISADEFFNRLRVHEDQAWDDETASVQLARIPLYLQIFLEVFRKTGHLPENRARLLKGLVDYLLARESAREDIGLDGYANELLLGGLSLRSTAAGYSLRFPQEYAREQLLDLLVSFAAQRSVATDVRLPDLWRRLLSANFLKSAGTRSVEWLHQLVRDYFLGSEYARIWDGGDPVLVQELRPRLGSLSWDVACTIALGLLDVEHGATFLLELITCQEENARRAFEGQTREFRFALIDLLAREIIDDDDTETKALRTITRVLPYTEVAEALEANFFVASSDEMRGLLTDAIAHLIVEHYPNVVNADSAVARYFRSSLEERRHHVVKAAVKRSQELLRKYLRSENEFVSFYAAKGLWEHDRAASAAQLKALSRSRDPRTISMVRELSEEWGIE